MRSDRFHRTLRRLACVLLTTAAIATSADALAPWDNDDVRCLLLSSGYTRLAKDDASRRGSAMTGGFYLGRLNERLTGAALAAALAAASKALAGQNAEPLMRTCVGRAQAAERTMAAAFAAAQPTR